MWFTQSVKIEIELSDKRWKEFKKIIEEHGEIDLPVSKIKKLWGDLAKISIAHFIKETKEREKPKKVRRQMQIKQKVKGLFDHLG